MAIHKELQTITEQIVRRSKTTRSQYLEKIDRAQKNGPNRAHLSCSGQAHAYAAMGSDQQTMAQGITPNLGIITAYNDMLSAHKPYETYPDLIRQTARDCNATAQVAGGVPAMCDGITQGENGMELSLFSRDVIALAAGVALSHNTFDAAVYLGVCDKIVPGLVMAAATFGHLPAVFLPAGPMVSGLANDKKADIRNKFATGDATREQLMQAEMAAYHGPGTCTFYGTANSNQMLMEFMGLHLPGSSFVNPGTPLREALTIAGSKRALEITALGDMYTPVGHILDEKTFVNGIVGLMATGGSTNLVLHMPAMARAAGIILEPQDFAAISQITPLLARVYPNGLADVNHFHAAGGLGYVISELLNAGLLHPDTKTIMGGGLENYTVEPQLDAGVLTWVTGAASSHNNKIVRPASDPFQPTGGLAKLSGNIGDGVMKVSAVAPERQSVTAPARVFHSQDGVKAAFKSGEFTSDTIVVLRFQGPRAKGMPELHSLTPILMVLQDRGLKVALVTDGRMSGASGKVPSAIHVCPEAACGGPLAKVRDGDMITVDAISGLLQVLDEGFASRPDVKLDLTTTPTGAGRELFEIFRQNVGPGNEGAAVVV
ncbi:MAG: phosphogluconate dehydratase [Paracoccaceae bacterium]